MINIVVCILISHELKPLHNKIGFSTNKIYVFLLIFGKLEEILSKIWFLKPAFFFNVFGYDRYRRFWVLSTTKSCIRKPYKRLNLISVSVSGVYCLSKTSLQFFRTYLVSCIIDQQDAWTGFFNNFHMDAYYILNAVSPTCTILSSFWIIFSLEYTEIWF